MLQGALAKRGSDNTKEEGQQTVEAAFNDLKYLICTFEARARWLAGQFVIVSVDVLGTLNALCRR